MNKTKQYQARQGSISKQSGYRFIYINGKQIQEHRHVIEQHLGRKLSVSELVHHLNHDKLDNRIENLLVVTRSEHKKIHHPDIGKATQLKKIFNFNPTTIYKAYLSNKSAIKVAEFMGCSEVTIRRVIYSHTGLTLSQLGKQLGWKMGRRGWIIK